MTLTRSTLINGLFVALTCLTQAAHCKTNNIDISPCVESFDAVRRADLLMAEKHLRTERARKAPRANVIDDFEKLIATAKTMSPVEYAKRNQSPTEEFYKGSSLSSLNMLAAELRRDMWVLLVKDVSAYRATKNLSPDATVELASTSAWEWQTMCIVAARISATAGKPVPQADQDLLRRFGGFVDTFVQTADSSSLAQKSPEAVASVAPAQAKAEVAPHLSAQVQAPGTSARSNSGREGESRLRTKSSSSCIFVGKPPGNSNPEVDWLGNKCDYDIGAVVICGIGHSGKYGYARQCAAGHWGIVGPVRKHDFTWLAEDRVYRAPLYQFAWCDNGKDPTNVKVSATEITGDCPP